jgi:hypothetical protein
MQRQGIAEVFIDERFVYAGGDVFHDETDSHSARYDSITGKSASAQSGCADSLPAAR